MIKVLLSLLFICSINVSLSQDYFFPQNDRKNPISRENFGISEAEFHGAIKTVQDFYTPWIKDNYNKTIEINGDWADDTVNAWVKPTTTGFYIQMFGGLARDSHTTLEGFYLVLLHEVGHAIGGAPKYARYGNPEWASAEGQSDYYSTAKGAKIIFDIDLLRTLSLYDDENKTEEQMFIKRNCDYVFEDDIKSAVCYRSALGGISLGNLLASFGSEKVDIQKPSTSKVTKTNVTGYPATQCRLDTYFQGALCDVDGKELPSMTDAKTGYCNKVDGYIKGIRPGCWFLSN